MPYNNEGYEYLKAAQKDNITSMLNFGAIRKGVALSSTQKAAVNAAAGVDAATAIYQQGYFMQVLDPGATVRGQRGSPVINFWYADGGAVQSITMASIDVM